MSLDNGLNLFQIGGWKISRNGIFYRAGSIAIANSFFTVKITGQKSIQGSGNISVTTSDPVYYINITIWLFFIIDILSRIIYDRTKGMARWVEATIEIGYSSVKLFIISLAVPVFLNVNLAVSSEQKKIST